MIDENSNAMVVKELMDWLEKKIFGQLKEALQMAYKRYIGCFKEDQSHCSFTGCIDII